MTYEQYRYDEYQRYAALLEEEPVDLTQFIFLLKYFEESIDVLHDKV